jgi:hypothetical protein
MRGDFDKGARHRYRARRIGAHGGRNQRDAGSQRHNEHGGKEKAPRRLLIVLES